MARNRKIHTASGMLMQEAEVLSSAGSTFDRKHVYVAGATSVFERNKGVFERNTALLVLTGACARFDRGMCSHAEAC
jgi:hypothetical protein